MASMVPGRLAAGGLGAVGGAYAVTKGPDAVQGFLNEAFPAWVNAARAALTSANGGEERNLVVRCDQGARNKSLRTTTRQKANREWRRLRRVAGRND